MPLRQLLAGLLLLLVGVGASQAAEASPPIDVMRPKHSTQLSEENFDEWLKLALENKQTAFVRWMAKGEIYGDCSWIGNGFLGSGDEDDVQHPSEPLDPEDHYGNATHDADGEDHFTKLTAQLKNDPCSVVRAQAAAWNAVVEEFKDDDEVVFGDVVLADGVHKDVVEKTKAHHDLHHELRKARHAENIPITDPHAEFNHSHSLSSDAKIQFGEPGVEPSDDDYLAEAAALGNDVDPPSDSDHTNRTNGAESFTAFTGEIGRHAHDSELRGCHITYYNVATHPGTGVPPPEHSWSAHCLDMLEPHDPGAATPTIQYSLAALASV